MKKLIMIAVLLLIARPEVATSCLPVPTCDNMCEVYWEFEDDGCMPTMYCYEPLLPNPTFGSRHWDDPTEDSGWGGSYGSDPWEWSDGVVTIPPFAEDSFNQPIPIRGEKLYLRQYFEVVHTMPEEPDPFGSIIGLGLEVWDMSVYQEGGWTGCPAGYEGLPGDGYINGDGFPAPESTTELGGGWYKTIWITDFAPDDSLGENGIEIGPELHDEATHAVCIIGMEVPSSFQIDEVYIKMVWHNYSGGITPDEFWYCTCFGSPPPPEPPLEFDPNFSVLFEPYDPETMGPPPQGPTSGTVRVRLKWQPEEPDDVYVIIDPNPDNEVTPNPDLILPASTEPNGVVRLVFNQANCRVWQTVVIKAVKDLEREGNENHKVSFSTETSGDPNFDGYETNRGNFVVDNDIPYIVALPDDIEVSENDPCTAEYFNVRLSHLPTADVKILVAKEGWAAEEGMFRITPPLGITDEPNCLTFTVNPVWDPCTMTSGFNIEQTICVNAVDNDILAEEWTEEIDGKIILTGQSEDEWYNDTGFGGELEAEEVDVEVQDNDCGAWGYMHVDVNKDCYVNLGDFALLSEQWLMCVQPYGDGCDKLWNLIEEEE